MQAAGTDAYQGLCSLGVLKLTVVVPAAQIL
jgi:hypothetical protein